MAEEEIGIDVKLVMSVEKLQEIQDELDKINEKASDEVLEIEQKYSHVRQPVYDRRNDIIKAIPDFWLTAFLSHPVLGELLTEEDHKIFKFLSSVEVEDSKDVKSGYTITFNFSSNPYFENTKLSKTYTFLEDGPTKITASTIQWTEGRGILNGVAHDKKGNKRPLAEESFFSWFSEVNQKYDGEDDEDVFLEIQDEVAEIIKDDLWPNPLTYFNNDPDDEDLEEDEGGDEGKDSEGSDDDDEDDEDGWCGATDYYCNPQWCQSQCKIPISSTKNRTRGFNVSAGMSYPRGRCGRQAGGVRCPTGVCTSVWGFCGTADEYCDPAFCQSQC